MSKEIKYYCDECKKELHSQACARITIFAHQGYSDPKSKLWKGNIRGWANAYWKHKEIYSHLLCPDCLGGYNKNVDFNHGDDPYFRLKDKAINILKRIGIIKNEKENKQQSIC